MTIGERIRIRRKELEMTQQQLANKMGKTKSAICKVETDKEQNLTLDRVSEFSKALNCSESYLMGWEDNNNAEYENLGGILAEIALNDTIMSAIEKLMQLNDSDKTIVLSMINSLYEKGEN